MGKLSRLLGRRAPKVQDLVGQADFVGLVDAARFHDVVELRGGELVDRGAPVREAALLALGELRDVGDEAIAEALADPVDAVRVAAVEALRRRGDFEVLCAAVVAWPSRGEGRARGAAIEALLELRAKGSSLALCDAFLAGVRDDRMAPGDAALVRALLETEAREAAWQEVLARLVGTLSGRSSVARDRAQDLLVTLAPASVEPLVQELTVGSARARAASTLGQTKDRRAIKPLVASLESPEAAVRAAACEALGELRDSVAVVPLMRLTRDPEHAVRAAAGDAIDDFGSVAVFVGLAALLGSTLDKGDAQGLEHRLLGNGWADAAEAGEADLAIIASQMMGRAGR